MDLTGLEASIQKVEERRGVVVVRPSGSGKDYRHGGIMRDTEVQIDPIETPEDENGETRQVGGLIELETNLMQTEATTSLRLMKEITSGRVDIILIPNEVAATTLTASGAEAAGDLKFPGRHLKVGARIKYDGSEGHLPASMGFRAPKSDLESFTL